MKKISVCMATFNGEQYIHAQIESILKQNRPSDEIVISDDCSTDSTLEIIRGFGDNRIRIIESPGFRNPIFNFENAILASVGDIIVLADQDDIWLDGRLDTIRSAFESSKSRFLLVVLDSAVVNKRLEVIQPSVFEFMHSGPGLFKNIYRNTYIGCHMAFSRNLVPLILPFPKKIPMHDMWIGLVSELVGRVVFVNSISMLFRRTGRNFTQPQNSWKTRFAWRINLVLSLLKFFISNLKIIILKS